MKSSRPDDVFLHLLTDCIVALKTLAVQFLEPQTATQLSGKTNSWAPGVRARSSRISNQGDSMASAAPFHSTEGDNAKNTGNTEVWLSQGWMGELAEMTGYWG